MYDPDDTPIATGGMIDMINLINSLREDINILHSKYSEEHTKYLELEAVNYRLKERIKKLEDKNCSLSWKLYPDDMGK